MDKITKIKNLLDEKNRGQKGDICDWLHKKLHWEPRPEDRIGRRILNESGEKIDEKIKNKLDELNWQEQQDICDWLHLKNHWEPCPGDGEEKRRRWNELKRETDEAEREVKVWQAEFLKVLWRYYVPMLKNANFPVPVSMKWRILKRYKKNAWVIPNDLQIWFDPTMINNKEQFFYHFLHEMAHLKAGIKAGKEHSDKFKEVYRYIIDAMGGDLKKAAKWEEGQPNVKSYLLKEAKHRDTEWKHKKANG